jgi:hypothetical protein
MGRFPGQPAYPRENLSCNFANYGPEHMINPIQGRFIQESQDETERLEPSQVGSIFSDKPKSQDPNRLEKQCATRDQRDRATEIRDEPELGRPASKCMR